MSDILNLSSHFEEMFVRRPLTLCDDGWGFAELMFLLRVHFEIQGESVSQKLKIRQIYIRFPGLLLPWSMTQHLDVLCSVDRIVAHATDFVTIFLLISSISGITAICDVR